MAMQAKYFEKQQKEGEKWQKGFVKEEITRKATIRASMMVKNRPLNAHGVSAMKKAEKDDYVPEMINTAVNRS